MEVVPDINIDEARAETDSLEFKSHFDPSVKADWFEIVKDVVAIANSGGGAIVFGLNSDGSHSGANVDAILSVDPADLTNKIHASTGQQFAAFLLERRTKNGIDVALMRIGAVRIPVVFTSSGNYLSLDGHPKTAFAKGSVYFRHGAKSEPGSTDDLRIAIERELAMVRDFWTQGIAKVVTAPPGSVVQVVKQEVSLRDTPDSTPFRLTMDSQAPAFRAILFDQLYPYRQKELISTINNRLGEKVVGPYDIQAVRFAFKMDDNPTLCSKSRWGSRQYSDACLEWLISEYRKDNSFFRKVRENLRKSRSEGQ